MLAPFFLFFQRLPVLQEPFEPNIRKQVIHQLSEYIEGYGSNISTKNCCLNNMEWMSDTCHNDLCIITVI